jgi:UDP-N-acetylmuramate dehydrogenase
MNIDTQQLSKILLPFKKTEKFLEGDISKLSTMRLKSVGHYIVVDLDEHLPELLQALTENKIFYRMIGWGANQILKEDARDTLYIKIKPPKDPQAYIEKIEEKYILPASFPLNVMVSKAMSFGFSGWEVLTGIPASLGGATYMNAGTKYGDIASIIGSVFVTNSKGVEREVIIDSKSFSYRKNHFIEIGDVITKVGIKNMGIDKVTIPPKIHEYMEYRKKTQPLQSFNCGCIFKNMDGVSAGKIIQDVGMKGAKVGGMRVSTLHGNFLENEGSGTAHDFWNLVELIQKKVKDKFGRELELEVNS